MEYTPKTFFENVKEEGVLYAIKEDWNHTSEGNKYAVIGAALGYLGSLGVQEAAIADNLVATRSFAGEYNAICSVFGAALGVFLDSNATSQVEEVVETK